MHDNRSQLDQYPNQTTTIPKILVGDGEDEVISKLFKSCGDDKKQCNICGFVVHAKNKERFVSHVANGCKGKETSIRNHCKNMLKNHRDKENGIEAKKINIKSSIVNEKIARFFFANHISFRVADSQSWRDIWKSVADDAYVPPCSKTLRTTLLEHEFNRVEKEVNRWISNQTGLTIVTDGWTSVRGHHMINIILCKTGIKPVFHSIHPTGASRQDASNIGEKLLQVIENIGVEKIIGLVTDNASNMVSSWNVVKEKYPHIAVHGCAAHAANLVMQWYMKEGNNEDLLSSCKEITSFFSRRYLATSVLEQIDALHKQSGLKTGGGLISPVDTRWFSAYDCMESVLRNKSVIHAFFASPNMQEVYGETYSFKRNKRNTGLDEFWNALNILVESSRCIRDLILKMESDDSLISDMLLDFLKLKTHHSMAVQDCVTKQLSNLQKPEVIAAFILDPRHDLNAIDYRIFLIGEEYILKERREVVDEYSSFIVDRKDESMRQDANKRGAKQWWATAGHFNYPNLSTFSLKLLMIPCSSAASERNWSLCSAIHTNKRNRLDEAQLNKLVSISTNSHLVYHGESNFIEEEDLYDDYQLDDIEALREEMDVDTSMSSSQSSAMSE